MKFVEYEAQDKATKCINCKGFIIFQNDDVKNESVGGLVRQHVVCPDCEAKTYLYAWNVLR